MQSNNIGSALSVAATTTPLSTVPSSLRSTKSVVSPMATANRTQTKVTKVRDVVAVVDVIAKDKVATVRVGAVAVVAAKIKVKAVVTITLVIAILLVAPLIVPRLDLPVLMVI